MNKTLAVFTGLSLFLWGLWLVIPGSASINDLRLQELVSTTGEEIKLGLFLMVFSAPSIFVTYIYERRPMLYILSKAVTLSLSLFGLLKILSIDYADPMAAFLLALVLSDSYALYQEFKAESNERDPDPTGESP